MSAEVKALVDRRWREYGIPTPMWATRAASVTIDGRTSG